MSILVPSLLAAYTRLRARGERTTNTPENKYPPVKPGALTDEPLKGGYKSVGRLKATAYTPSRI